MQETLGMALGELGVIRTERRIFEKDNIVISLDNIEDMGEFIDITVFFYFITEKAHRKT